MTDIVSGSSIILPAGPGRSGYTFQGWQREGISDCYAAGTPYAVSEHVIFDADFKKKRSPRISVSTKPPVNTHVVTTTKSEQGRIEASSAMAWACGAGIVKGTTDQTLSPASDASRAQMATIIYKYHTSVQLIIK